MRPEPQIRHRSGVPDFLPKQKTDVDQSCSYYWRHVESFRMHVFARRLEAALEAVQRDETSAYSRTEPATKKLQKNIIMRKNYKINLLSTTNVSCSSPQDLIVN